MVSRAGESRLEDARRMYRDSEFLKKALIIGMAVFVLILLMIYFFRN